MNGLVPVQDCTTAAEVIALARAAHLRMRAYDRRIISPAVGIVRRVKIVEKPAASVPVSDVVETVEEQAPAPVSVEAFTRAADVMAAEALILAGRRHPTVHWIATRVASHYGLDVREIISQRRQKELVLVRHKIYWLCIATTTMSFVNIGQVFGGRDHTTVLHGVRKMNRLLAEDCPSVADLDQLRIALEAEWAATKAVVALPVQEAE